MKHMLVCFALLGCERKPAMEVDSSSSPPSAAPSVATSAEAAEAGPAPMATHFEAVVGDWIADPKSGFWVDGTAWRQGTPSASIADSAKRLYGDKSAEFLDGVKAFAFFPLAVSDAPPTSKARVSVRFKPESGKIDQAAGIAFGIRQDGSYFGVRANALEDNILVFEVVRGQRTVLQTIRSTPTPTRAWHDLVVSFEGRAVKAWLDGTARVDTKVDADVGGRVGLWSKADSKVLFDDFKVE